MSTLRQKIVEIHKAVRHDVKLTLTFYLSFIGALFLLVFSIVAIVNDQYIVASYLILPLIFGLLNVTLLRSGKCAYASLNLAFICALISLLLLAHGGREQTGIFWTYPLIAIAIAILPYRHGLIYAASYITLAIGVLYFAPDNAFFTDYQGITRSRYLYSCLALCAISLTLVYIQDNITSQLQTKTITDELTGLYNRAIIRDALDNNSPIKSDNTKASLLMIDIDYFKNINDDFGHATGDQVLVSVSKILKESVRSNDLAIRWGGEEFLLVLVDCPLQDAIDKAEVISQKLKHNEQLQALVNRGVTLSIGVYEMTSAEDLHESIKQADLNLYKAKSDGRSRVVFGAEKTAV